MNGITQKWYYFECSKIMSRFENKAEEGHRQLRSSAPIIIQRKLKLPPLNALEIRGNLFINKIKIFLSIVNF